MNPTIKPDHKKVIAVIDYLCGTINPQISAVRDEELGGLGGWRFTFSFFHDGEKIEITGVVSDWEIRGKEKQRQ